MKFDRVPGITKYLSVVFLLNRLGENLVWFFLPIFFKLHIESVFLVGIMTSLPAVIPVLMDMPTGNLVQRAGAKIVIFLGLLINLFPALFYITAVPLLLVAGKIFEGVVKAMIWNGGWTLSLKEADEDIEAESTSVFLLGLNLTTIVAPMIGGFLIAAKGFNLTFSLWVFTSWLAALVFYLYIGLEGKKGFIDSLEDVLHRSTYKDDYKDIKQNWQNLKLPISLIFFHSIIFSFFWLAIPLLLDKVGAGYEMMGVIFGLAALPRIFQFLFGELGDKIGDVKLTAILSILLAPILVAMGLFSSIYILGGLFLIARLLNAGITPLVHSFYDLKTPDELEGELTGFMELCKHSGQALGPFIAGTVASIWSINASFHFAAGVAFLITAFSLYTVRKS